MTPIGLTATELTDIQQLNRAFLRLVRAEPEIARPIAAGLPPALAARFAAGELTDTLLGDPVSFLLFEVALPAAPSPATALFRASPAAIELGLLALGFMQRLGRREQFAVRVCAGLTNDELERLLGATVNDFGRLVRSVEQPVTPALCQPAFLWPTLLTAAANADGQRLKTLFALGHQHRLHRLMEPVVPQRRAARAIGVAERISER
ncbi:MAG: hypothetical protein AAGH76_17890 [Pseudomonadota bacterium]